MAKGRKFALGAWEYGGLGGDIKSATHATQRWILANWAKIPGWWDGLMLSFDLIFFHISPFGCKSQHSEIASTKQLFKGGVQNFDMVSSIYRFDILRRSMLFGF